jgi:hypothetical protein
MFLDTNLVVFDPFEYENIHIYLHLLPLMNSDHDRLRLAFSDEFDFQTK